MDMDNKENFQFEEDVLVECTNGADFETAVTAVGFGKFNYIVLLVTFISSIANAFSSTTMSYVGPVAECDLALTLSEKGLLNASVYLGNLSSVFMWGFLADAYGRRKLLIYGQILDTIFNVACAFSQSFTMLFVCKYFTGFTGSGCYTILLSYIAELHSSKHRSRVMIITGGFMSAGNLILPFIAWAILPLDLSLDLYIISINSWRLFMLICSLPPLLSAIGHKFLPESPKFLMSNGKNEDALKVFELIYGINSGQDKNLYTIKSLVNEIRPGQHNLKENINKKNNFRNGLKQTKKMFSRQHLLNFILVNLLQIGCMLGSNTLRLWLPQFFITIDEYEQKHQTSDVSLCEILEYKEHKNISSTNISLEECVIGEIDNMVYIKSIIVAIWGVVGYFFVGTLINIMGKKYLLLSTFFIGSVSALAIYWSRSSLAILSLSSIFITLGSICIQVTFAVCVDLFPTSLRTMVMSMTVIFGRFGAMLGNVVFPLLLEINCLPPFLLISGVTFLSAIASLFLPNKTPEFT